MLLAVTSIQQTFLKRDVPDSTSFWNSIVARPSLGCPKPDKVRGDDALKLMLSRSRKRLEFPERGRATRRLC
jgi:hypothetical protein